MQLIDNFALTEMIIRSYVQSDFCKKHCVEGEYCASQREFFGKVYAWVMVYGIGKNGKLDKRDMESLKKDIDREFTCQHNVERLIYNNGR